MGASISQLVHEEVNWVKPHELIYNQELRKQQLKLLPNFGKKLKLCFIENVLYGVKYKHWYVTDGTYVIEFGGGELSDATIIVHCNPKSNTIIESKFANSDEVMERMRNLCGATNYSLALRNCEHAAR